MTRTVFIRLGGLVAVVGGVGSAALGLLIALQAGGASLGSFGMGLQKGHYENQVLTMLLLGALAAIATLHLLQRASYGRVGTLASLAAFVGGAMIVGGNLVGELLPTRAGAGYSIAFGGLLVASVGVLVLGIVTISTRILPWWCGAAMIAGSPPFVGIGFIVVSFVEATLHSLGLRSEFPGGIGWGGLWILAGAPWVLVGYAVLRVATQQTQQPSRARVKE